MKVRKFFLRLLFLPVIRWFVPKRWLSEMYLRETGPEEIMALRLKTYNEIKAILADGEKAKDSLAKALAEHKIQSEPRPDGGVAWSCSCGARGRSADRRDHWADLLIREMNDTAAKHGWPQRTPESEREQREQIFAAIDDHLRGQL